LPTLAYVTNTYSNSVSVINMSTNRVVATVPVGNGPFGVAVTPDGRFVYIAYVKEPYVSVLDTSTFKEVAQVRVLFAQGIQGAGAQGALAVSPNGAFVYDPIFSSNVVQVISTSTNRVVANVTVGTQPNNVTFSPDGKYAWVPDYGDGYVYVINTATNLLAAKISVGGYANGCIFSPDGKTAYVTSIGTASSRGALFVINASSYQVTKTIPMVVPTGGPAITQDGRYVYVALYNPTNGTLVVVSTSTYQVVKSITLGPRPNSVLNSADGNYMYVPILAGPTLGQWTPTSNSWISVVSIATNTIVANITVELDPAAMAWGPIDSI